MDNSVLFSLNELKILEDDRLRAEAEAEEARRQTEHRARLEAEEQAQREVEAAVQAARDEARRQAEARERARLDEEVRIIHLEARLEERIEEEAQRLLDAARRDAETHVEEMEAEARRPVWNVVALSLGALLVVVGMGAWLMSRADVATERTEAVMQRHAERQRARLVAAHEVERRRSAAEMSDLRERLQAATSEVERERVRERLAEAAAAAAQREREKVARKQAAKKAVKKVAAAAKPKPKSEPVLSDTLLGD